MKILYIDPETEYAPIRAAWLEINDHIVDVSSGLSGPNYKDYGLVIINLGERGSKNYDLRPQISTYDKGDLRISSKVPVIFANADRDDILFATTHGAITCKLYELSQENSLRGILEKAVGNGRGLSTTN